VFKIGDISTAEEFSKLIGKTEATYFSYSESNTDGVSNSDHGGSRVQSNSSSYSESTKLEYIIEPEELIKLPAHTAVVTYNGTFGTLNMPVYWDYFDTPVRIAKASPSDWLEHQKNNEVA
jgi:type IV secretory pathway TraG/TraD family ATPase VirD4